MMAGFSRTPRRAGAASACLGWLLACWCLISPALAQGPFVEPGPREQYLRTLIPDRELAANPRLVLYTEREQPRVYQFNMTQAPRMTFHRASYNISAEPSEPFGNANIEFPWGGPGGTHRCQNVGSFKFILLPEGKPIVWFQARKPQADGAMGYDWVYPRGALVGEVLTMRSPRTGRPVTFELRTRERTATGWEPNVLRPFPTTLHLASAIKLIAPDWRQRPDLARLVAHLESDIELPRRELRDSHPHAAFHAAAEVDLLPPIHDPSIVDRLLSEFEFDSALEQTWRGDDCFAPTTQAAWHIVPANYDATFLGASRESCNRCHNTVGMATDQFDQPRDWYGLVRGGDQILSFSPVDPSCASDNGGSWPVRMLRLPGVVEPYDAARHLPSDYRRLP